MKHELPLRLSDLLHCRVVESNRVEFKAGWNDVIRRAVVQSVCAFANDLLNLNGGYIVLGVTEQEGQPVLPPLGLGPVNLDRIQKEVFQACRNLSPDYQPLISIEHSEDRPLIVLWCPGGDNRPYLVRDQEGKNNYYVRHGAVTKRAEHDTLRQLHEQTARTPFDDRRSLEARIEDLSPTLLRRFLYQVGSHLIDEPVEDRDLYRRLRLTVQVNGPSSEVPRNVGVLFFSNDPERFLRSVGIDVVRHGEGGDLLSERTFRGPLDEQARQALDAITGMTGTVIRKIPGQITAEHQTPYPADAVREAIINAVYHRGYDGPPEPVKVYLYRDRLEVTSYPGPLPGVQHAHLIPGANSPSVPARNRRIGDLLKELRLAEARGTGIPKIYRRMKESGGAPPTFDFDEERTYFRTTLYLHPAFIVDEARSLRHRGEGAEAIALLGPAVARQPGRWDLALEQIALLLSRGDHPGVKAAVEQHRAAVARGEGIGDDDGGEGEHLYLHVSASLIEHGLPREALSILWVASKQARMHTGTHLYHARLVREAGDPAWAYDLYREMTSWAESPALYAALAEIAAQLAAGRPRDEREQLLAESMEWSERKNKG